MIGDIFPFSGGDAALPSDFMLCRGQLLTVSDNADLFGVIGTTYGGDGITNFKLPNIDPIDASTEYVIVVEEIEPIIATDSAINRTTLETHINIDGSVYDSAIWIINPNLSSVASVPKKYWKISGDDVVEMSQSEKDAIDAESVVTTTESAIKMIKKITRADGSIISEEIQLPAELIGDDTVLKTQITGPADAERQFFALGNGDSLFSALENATNIFDIELETEHVGADGTVQLFGGEYWTNGNTKEGDYLEFAVVDKDDVLGYFATLGLTVGTDVLELAKYVKRRPVVADSHEEVHPGTTALLVQGLYLRTIYVSTSDAGTRKLRVSFDLAK